MWRVVLREQEGTPLMLAIEMHTGGAEMVRQLLDAKADVNLMAQVISLPTFRVVSEELCHSEMCRMMWSLIRRSAQPGGVCSRTIIEPGGLRTRKTSGHS